MSSAAIVEAEGLSRDRFPHGCDDERQGRYGHAAPSGSLARHGAVIARHTELGRLGSLLALPVLGGEGRVWKRVAVV
jgi:hypothetical protein